MCININILLYLVPFSCVKVIKISIKDDSSDWVLPWRLNYWNWLLPSLVSETALEALSRTQEKNIKKVKGEVTMELFTQSTVT